MKSTPTALKNDEESVQVKPLRPRRGLFYLLMGAFIGWLVFLSVMFVRTVYPHPDLDPHRRTASGTTTAGATDR